MLRLATLLLILPGIPGLLPAQTPRVRVGIAAGRFGQGAPTTVEAGYVVLMRLASARARDLRFEPAIEYSHSYVESRLAVCHFVGPSGDCFRRADAESIVAVSGAVDIRLFPGAPVHMHVAPGLAVARALGAQTVGERRDFIAPQATLGAVWGREAEWRVDLRLRRLDRWSPLTAHGQGALLFGVTF